MRKKKGNQVDIAPGCLYILTVDSNRCSKNINILNTTLSSSDIGTICSRETKNLPKILVLRIQSCCSNVNHTKDMI